MNPYLSTHTEDEARQPTFFIYSHYIAAACIVLSLGVSQATSSEYFDILRVLVMIFWLGLAALLWRKPRWWGLVIGMLMLASILTQYWVTSEAIKSFVGDRDIGVKSGFWAKYWLSLLPLIVGVPFAFLSHWLSRRS